MECLDNIREPCFPLDDDSSFSILRRIDAPIVVWDHPFGYRTEGLFDSG